VEAAAAAQLNAGQKRKRSEVDESDAKLKEFLEVMQPAAKSKAWAAQAEDSEPPTKIQAIEIPDGESDGEYEAIPKKLRAKSPPKPTLLPEPSPVVVLADKPAENEELITDASRPGLTDDEWLRSRTDRLLDLVDPDDIAPAQEVLPKPIANVVEQQLIKETKESNKDELPVAEEVGIEEFEEEQPDPTIEAIKSSGRLFVRNLAYTATEQELRERFELYGSLEEVRMHFICISFVSAFMMNIQIGTAYAFQACDVNWTRILVDASCFLIAFNTIIYIFRNLVVSNANDI